MATTETNTAALFDSLSYYLAPKLIADLAKLSNEELATIIISGYREFTRVKILENSALNVPFQKAEKSVIRGAQGEEYVREILKDYPIQSTGAKSGDMIIPVGNGANGSNGADGITTTSVLIEVKDYTRTVPSEEVEKFKRDIDNTAATAGLFVSLSSPIANTPKFAKKYIAVGGRVVPVVLLSGDLPELIILATELLLGEIRNSQVKFQVSISPHINEIVDRVSQISDELQCISEARTTISELHSGFTKSIFKLYSSVTSYESHIRGHIAAIRDQLALLDDSDISVESPNEALLDGFTTPHRDLLQKLLSGVCGKWKKTKTKLVHESGLTFTFYKSKCEFSMPCKLLPVEQITRLIMIDQIRVDSGHVYVCVDPRNTSLITELILRE